jgi:hypothetical protein
MFIELVDQLRCAREHEDSWLVASVERADARDIVDGTLGCPVCGTRYPIARGVADLRVPEARAPFAGARAAALPDEEAVLRVAAMLDLVERGGFVVLVGAWATLARSLVRLIDGVHVLAVNAPDEEREENVSHLRVAGPLPLGEASARGAALDLPHAGAADVDRAGVILRASGRLVAPASAPVPDSCTELARDTDWWVAERTPGLSGPVKLRRDS